MKRQKSFLRVAKSNGGFFALGLSFILSYFLFAGIFLMPALLALPLTVALSSFGYLTKVCFDYFTRKNLPEEVIEKADNAIKDASWNQEWSLKIKNIRQLKPQSNASREFVKELATIHNQAVDELYSKVKTKENELKKEQYGGTYTWFSKPLNSENQAKLDKFKLEAATDINQAKVGKEKLATRSYIADERNPGKHTFRLVIDSFFQPTKPVAAGSKAEPEAQTTASPSPS